ncbi:MAG: hypothetical protein ACI4OT_03155 [Bacilli bacterium]
MKVKNLYIVNTKLITKVINHSNFNKEVTSIDNGYKIVEKRIYKGTYQKKPSKKFFIPETNQAIDLYYGQDQGEIYRTRPVYPLNKYYKKEDITLDEINELEKELNEKGLKKQKKR